MGIDFIFFDLNNGFILLIFLQSFSQFSVI